MVGERLAFRRSEISVPAFMGREREVAELGRMLAQPPTVVLVEGEPGAGKSRLVQEFLASSAGRRHRLLVAVCPPYREALTLGPIVDAVRQATDSVSGLRLSALAGALRPLLPEWSEQLPPLPAELHDPKAARHRLFRSLAELVRVLGFDGLVVEDVHWADPGTMEFLLFLAAHPGARQRSVPACLVLTYRADEVEPGSSLRRLSSRLPAGTSQARLTLPPLDVAETAGMVSSMLDGDQVSEEFARFLHERTGGVPLAVEESVRLLRDRADLARRNGEWTRRQLPDLQVSPTLRDSVLERVQRLDAAAQRLLRAAAVLAEPTDNQVLAEVSCLDVEAASEAATDAVAAGLLAEVDSVRLGFRHAFMAQVVYESVPQAERRKLHRLAGQALQRQDPPPVGQLTRHFREAGEVGSWSRYAEQAARRAVAGGDHTSATGLLADLLATADLPADTARRLGRELAGNALMRREPVDELHRKVIDTLRRVLDTTRLAPSDQAAIRSRLGRLLAQAGESDAARIELERAIPYLPGDSGEAARAMTYLGWPWLGLRPAREHLVWLRRVAEINPAKLSITDRVVVTADRAAALLQLGDPAGWAVAEELTGELPEHSSDPELRRLLIRTHLNLGSAAMLWGRYRLARQRFEAGLGLSDATSFPRLHGKISMSMAEHAWYTGDWSELPARVARFLEIDDGDPVQLLGATCLAGRLQAATGSRRRAEEHLERALASARALGAAEETLEPAAVLGRLWLADGRVSEALRVTEEPIQPIISQGTWMFATSLAPVRVEALLAAGRVDDAETLVTAYERGLGDRYVPICAAGLALCRGLLAQSRAEPAAQWFARAAELWEQLPRPYDLLLARERQADCLVAAGHPELGISMLNDTWQRLAGLGARVDADRIALRLREHGIDVRRQWRGGRRGYGGRPSPRELEVIRLVLAGKTNREIAASLHKSPRTVAGQLASVMRKLGVSSRTELAVRVVEEGLLTADRGAEQR